MQTKDILKQDVNTECGENYRRKTHCFSLIQSYAIPALTFFELHGNYQAIWTETLKTAKTICFTLRTRNFLLQRKKKNHLANHWITCNLCYYFWYGLMIAVKQLQLVSLLMFYNLERGEFMNSSLLFTWSLVGMIFLKALTSSYLCSISNRKRFGSISDAPICQIPHIPRALVSIKFLH